MHPNDVGLGCSEPHAVKPGVDISSTVAHARESVGRDRDPNRYPGPVC